MKLSLVVIIVSYLIGSIPFSFLMGKFWGRLDLSTRGSGNLGGTNAVRVLGWGPGILAGLGDIAKGVVSVWLADRLVGTEFVKTLAILAVTIGHNWSLFFLWEKGGKGISTTLGGFLYFNPVVTLIGLGVALEIILLSRLVSLASLILVTLIPIGLILTGTNWSSVVVSVLLTLIAFWRHRENIRRLSAGEERRLGVKE